MGTVKLSERVWQDPIYFIAFGFGSGLMPKAPGTWGTLAAIPLYWLIAGSSARVYLTLTLLAFILGVIVSEKVTRDLQIQDYPGIVWDEVVGYLLTMYLAPAGLFWMVLGFGLFRLFDIWKPQPIGWLDNKIGGGLGVMMDDVVAAIPAWFILQLLAWILR